MLHQLPLSKNIFHWKMKAGALCSHVLYNSQDFVQNHGGSVIVILASSVTMWYYIFPTMKWFRRNSSFCSSIGFVVIIPRRYSLEDRYPFGRHPGRIYNVSWCLVSSYSTWGFCGFVLSCLETRTMPITKGHSGDDCIMGHEDISLLQSLDA